MNLFVADPQWGWWIILYFYLGGLAAGAYFLATLIELWGRDEDRALARIGYRLAFPLVAVCGILLVVDLDRPERFWHMLLQSERVNEALDEGWPAGGWRTMLQALMFKWWSPMSIGAWALFLFGGFSFASFVAGIRTSGWTARLLGSKVFGRGFQLVGSGIGFFVASYTGVLVTATNQPLWSDSPWLGALFLTSAASTGIAVVIILGRWRGGITAESMERLERADLWALGLELIFFLIFLASLGSIVFLALQTWPGVVLVAGTLLLGLVIPLGMHLRRGIIGPRRMIGAALCALVGGFFLRYGVVRVAPAILERYGNSASVVQRLSGGQEGTPAALFNISPEDGRPRGGDAGASSMNRPPTTIRTRTKLTETTADERQ